jgi:hypothetical protein
VGLALIVLAGCGGDDGVRDVTDQANEIRHDIREGASADEIRQQLKELESNARDQGEDAKREAQRLRRQLERQLP